MRVSRCISTPATTRGTRRMPTLSSTNGCCSSGAEHPVAANSAGLARLGRAEPRNELLVRRHHFHAARDDVAHASDQLDDLLLGNQVDRGVIAVGHEV